MSALTRCRAPGPARSTAGGAAASRPGSQPLDDGDVGLAATLAHRLQPVSAAGALELVQHRRHQPGTRCAEGMTEGEGAAVDVDLGQVGPGFLLPGENY